MDVWDYFEQRERECEQLGLSPVGSLEDMFSELAGSDGQRGRMFGRFELRPGAYLKVSELVVASGEAGRDVHREEYAYFLAVDGREIWGRERDPSHNPAEHGHGPNHAYVSAGRVSFKEAVAVAWDALKDYDDRQRRRRR